MIRDFLNPADLPNWSESFSQVVAVRTGSTVTVYVSGQVSVDADNVVVGRGDLRRQTQVSLENLTNALAAAGAKLEDVVRLGIFIKDYRPEHAAIIGSALRGKFAAGRMPASTWLGVSALALDDLLIEIEAVAVIDVVKV